LREVAIGKRLKGEREERKGIIKGTEGSYRRNGILILPAGETNIAKWNPT
jgi:hypothetical protein